NHLARSRLNYQFTREFSLRMIVDYNGVLENPALVNLQRQKRVTGDVLLTYLIHPGTALYVGYTDRLETLRLFPGAPPSGGLSAPPLKSPPTRLGFSRSSAAGGSTLRARIRMRKPGAKRSI